MASSRPTGISHEEAEASIIPGKILHLNVQLPFADSSMNKYLVYVGEDNNPLFLKINSENNATKLSQKFRERQFRLKKTTYSFLEYDSYLDCGTVWNLISKEDTITQLMVLPTRICGDLSPDHINELLKLALESKSISNINKRIISKSFGR